MLAALLKLLLLLLAAKSVRLLMMVSMPKPELLVDGAGVVMSMAMLMRSLELLLLLLSTSLALLLPLLLLLLSRRGASRVQAALEAMWQGPRGCSSRRRESAHGVVFAHSREMAGRLPVGGDEARTRMGWLVCATLGMLLRLVSKHVAEEARVKTGTVREKPRGCAGC